MGQSERNRKPVRAQNILSKSRKSTVVKASKQ